MWMQTDYSHLVESLLYGATTNTRRTPGRALVALPDQETVQTSALMRQLLTAGQRDLHEVLVTKRHPLLAACWFAEQQMYLGQSLPLMNGIGLALVEAGWADDLELLAARRLIEPLRIRVEQTTAGPLPQSLQYRVWKMAFYRHLCSGADLNDQLLNHVKRKTLAYELAALSNFSEVDDRETLAEWFTASRTWACAEMARDYGRSLPAQTAAIATITAITAAERFELFRVIAGGSDPVAALGAAIISQASLLAYS
jgi:hypothetical protein